LNDDHDRSTNEDPLLEGLEKERVISDSYRGCYEHPLRLGWRGRDEQTRGTKDGGESERWTSHVSLRAGRLGGRSPRGI
jgi:hypothetical protein